MKVAIIPARGGSKRIPRKNVRVFGGMPMITWSIAAAIESGCFDRIIVSTDDKEIATTARAAGAETPFIRPAAISDDQTGTLAVIAHASKWLNENANSVDLACCLYATAPFILADDLRRGLQILQQDNLDYAFGVTRYPFPIQRAIRITPSNRVEMFEPEHFATRSQDLEESWHDAGQFYWGRADAWLQQRPIFSKQSSPVVLPGSRVQDIDTEEDWLRAEWMFKALKC
jgi:pseudaminic acid cytidylyltransferase